MPGRRSTQKRTRRHHFIPAFYLAGFTLEDNRHGTLHVFDTQNRRAWRSTPDGTAHQRDFNAVDSVPSEGPNFVEDRLAQQEGKWADALRHIIASQSLVSDDIYSDLMVFLAFTIARIPRFRNIVAGFVDRSERHKLAAQISTETGWQQFAQAIESSSSLTQMQRELLADPEPFRKMLNDGCTVEYDQTWHVQTMIHSALTLMPVLGEWHWSIWAAGNKAPDFICSDCPVCLTWIDERERQQPPGFGLPNTVVTLPLNRRTGLIGVYGLVPPAKIEATAEHVDRMNARTALFASHVFSSGPFEPNVQSVAKKTAEST